MMYGEDLDRELKKALCDRFEGWELVEFLQIPVEEVIDAFENYINESLDDVLDFAGLRELDIDNSD